MTRLPEEIAARILDGSPDAILICDRMGMVRYWNRGAERVFGFPSAEIVGASMDLIIPERLRARHWAGWETAMKTGVTMYDDGQLLAVPALHKDGRQISIEFSIQLLKDSNGQVEWVVAVLRDVTERFKRDKALRAAENDRLTRPTRGPLQNSQAARVAPRPADPRLESPADGRVVATAAPAGVCVLAT